MKKIKNIVFGCTSSIGIEISKKLKKDETLLTSRKPIFNKSNWLKNDLNKNNFKKFPKKVDKIFFAASPYYLKKNLKSKKNVYIKELRWIKNCLTNIKCNQIIYISSPSIYVREHPIGMIKLKCEKFIMKTLPKRYQIWRPYNLIGDGISSNLSDHLHNFLIKEILIKKKKFIKLNGNYNDLIGYSSAKKFSIELIENINSIKPLILDYKNKHQIKLGKIVDIFMKYFNVEFKYQFKHEKRFKKKDKKNIIFSNENSISIIKKYFKKYKDEKKL